MRQVLIVVLMLVRRFARDGAGRRGVAAGNAQLSYHLTVGTLGHEPTAFPAFAALQPATR